MIMWTLSKTTKLIKLSTATYKKCIITLRHRDVAQLGSALPWGGRGRQFKSDRSDQLILNEIYLVFSLLIFENHTKMFTTVYKMRFLYWFIYRIYIVIFSYI